MPSPPEPKSRPAVVTKFSSRNLPLTPKVAVKANTPASSVKRINPDRDENTAISPVPAHLGYNHTSPRVGHLQRHVGIQTTTPPRPPLPERPDWDSRSALSTTITNVVAALGSGIVLLDTDKPILKESVVLDPFTDSKLGAKQVSPRPQLQRQPIKSALSIQKTSHFVYANGETIIPGTSSLPTSPITSTFTSSFVQSPTAGKNSESSSIKFVYANGIPDVSPPIKTTTSPGSTGSALSARTAPAGHVRPLSPVKQEWKPSSPRPLLSKLHSTPPVALRGPVLQPVRCRTPQSGRVSPQAHTAAPTRRKVSLEKVPSTDLTHTRSENVESTQTARGGTEVSGTSSALSSPASSSIANRSNSLANQVLSPGHQSSPPPPLSCLPSCDPLPSEPHSPTRSAYSHDLAVSEVVANARRERKVQDLEITNASLEAINRTLERQLRKQTTEIRRFRRLSLATLAPRSRVVSTSLRAADGLANFLATDAMGLPELSDIELDEDEDGSDGDDDSYLESRSSSNRTSYSAASSSPISDLGLLPSFPDRAHGTDPDASRSARRRQRDERRLQLDLSKHRQLLVDSQKLNQSLKRCLTSTEELIRDGQKALAYHVRISDVRLGGRVLLPVDNDDDDDREHNPGGDEPLCNDPADDADDDAHPPLSEITALRDGPLDYRNRSVDPPLDAG